MRLTLHTDYALRMLMVLALDPVRPHTIEDISTRYGISKNHLMKVAQTLVQAGLVDSLRGRGGGLRLAREPGLIHLGDVVRATEDGFSLVECFGPDNQCIVSAACGLRNPLREALAAFLGVLDRYTIADLVANPAAAKRMHRLLSTATLPH
jgi:Rrf2 family nitric oxide-sensitive transcriptional repressor